jgi:D-aminopeptidase
MMMNENVKSLKARSLGWINTSDLKTGPHNAITDVPGVSVGHTTLIQGEPGPLAAGYGPIRTGVTAIRPHSGNLFTSKVKAGVYVLNGFGKTVGLEQIRELGVLETPILLTNTLNVWRCADALVDWAIQQNADTEVTTGTINPVVGECNDGWLNDIQGRHVTREHVFASLDSASNRPVAEGNVGAGTGTTCYQFKGGIGTASRVLPKGSGGYTLGVLLQVNFGAREQLIICGQPVGKWLKEWPENPHPNTGKTEIASSHEGCGDGLQPHERTMDKEQRAEDGSCMMVIATDAPLSSRQLGRLARRVPLGLARTGFSSGQGSGDYVIAFSTTRHTGPGESAITQSVEWMPDECKTFQILIQSVVEASEEAVLNALIAAKTMTGRDGHTSHALPVDIIQELMPST